MSRLLDSELVLWKNGSYIASTARLVLCLSLHLFSRTTSDDAAARRRTDAAVAWLREAFSEV